MNSQKQQIDNNVNINEWRSLLKVESPLPQNELFLGLLDQNMASLTTYLEDLILDNPFIEVEYYVEQLIPSLEKMQERNTSSESSSTDSQTTLDRQSIETYLFEQIMLYRQTPIRDVMVHLLEYLDERGFITKHADEIARELGENYFTVLDALTLFKTLEPAGIGAYDLRECLMLQAERDEQAPSITYLLLESFFEQLVQKDYQYIMKKTSFNLEEIEEVIRYIQTLHHQNAHVFNETRQPYLVADVLMTTEESDNIQITYHRQAAPKLVFKENYFNEMRQVNDELMQSYLDDKQTQYDRFVKYLSLREKLLLIVTAEIIKIQSHLIQGGQEVKELTIKELSKATQIPQSYIIRLISGKSLMYQNRIFVLSDFINCRYSLGCDGLSADYFRQKVQEIIATVKNNDNKAIQETLANQGITISNKVIEMYRQGSNHSYVNDHKNICQCGFDGEHQNIDNKQCHCRHDHGSMDNCDCHD